jgi:hypothetical protein
LMPSVHAVEVPDDRRGSATQIGNQEGRFDCLVDVKGNLKGHQRTDPVDPER